MSETPPGESPPRRSIGRRFAPLAIVAVLLLAAGFALGRVTDSGSSDGSSATTATGPGAGTTPGDTVGGVKGKNDYDLADVAKVFPPNIVRDGEIEAQKEGTPEHALLVWWQSFQFQDVAAVEALSSQATLDAIGKRQLAELVRVRGAGFQGIEVFGASESGDTATVRAGLLQFEAEEGKPPPTTPTGSTPTTFAMTKEGGEWLFDQPEHLAPMVESLPE